MIEVCSDHDGLTAELRMRSRDHTDDVRRLDPPRRGEGVEARAR